MSQESTEWTDFLHPKKTKDEFYEFLRDYYLSNDGTNIKTDLNKDMVLNITALEVIDKIIKDEFGFSSSVIKTLVERYKVNVINLNRKERAEVIEALKAMNPETKTDAQHKNLLHKLIGI